MTTAVTMVLLAPAAIEEELIELLLTHEATASAGFTTRDVGGRGTRAVYRSVDEQIRGSTRLVEITLTAAEPDIRSLVADLSRRMSGHGINYVIMPVTTCGQIG